MFDVSRMTVHCWHKKVYPESIRKCISHERGLEIANAYHTGKYTQKEVAKLFKISRTSVSEWHRKFYGTRSPRKRPTDEFKKQVADKYHEGGYSQGEIGKMFGITNTSVGNWHKKFYGTRTFGGKKQIKISDELGKEIADTYHKGDYSQAKVGEMFGVSAKTVRNWYHKFYGNQKPQSE